VAVEAPKVGLGSGVELRVAVGIGRVDVGLGSGVELRVAVGIGRVGVGLGSGVEPRVAVGAADVELGVGGRVHGFIVRAFTIQARSDPPASENSRVSEPPDTDTANVLAAKPPTAVSTSPRTVVPLAFTTILSWA
jgi:hypothetical protein